MTLTLPETPTGRRAKRYDQFADLAAFDLRYVPRHLDTPVTPTRRNRFRAIAVSAGPTLLVVGLLALAAAQTIGGAR